MKRPARDRKVPINIDADPNNADWPKRTLDLPVRTVDELRRYLAGCGMTAHEFKSLPAYRLALKSGRYEWLRDL